MKTLFNEGWLFAEVPLDQSLMQKDGKPALLEPTAFFAEAQKQNYKSVSVPHDWMITDTNNLYRNSVGFYKKTFELKSAGRTAIYFEGVYMNCAVYVNGELAGGWKYGYASFELDISRLVKNGANEMLVICVYQSPNTRWYSGAGIFRDVYLIQTSQNFLVTNGTYIRNRKASGEEWNVKISAEVAFEQNAQDLKIRHTIWKKSLRQEALENAKAPENAASYTATPTPLDESETQNLSRIVCGIAGRKIATSQIEFNVKNPDLWDTQNPNLYYISTELLDKDGNVLDAKIEYTAFRTIEFTADKGMFLNGVRTKLFGVCQHHDLGGLGAAFNINALKRQFIRLREMGVNAIRTSHNPVSSGFWNLADEMGFMVDDDGFDMWEMPKTSYDYGNYFNEWSERDCVSWVRNDRNHPALIMWSVGNEIYDTHAGNGLQITKNLSRYVRSMDSESNAPITIASNYMMTDGAQDCAKEIETVGYNYLERLYDEHHNKYPEWKIYGSETASTIQSRGIYHFPLTMSLVTHDDRQCSALGNCTTTWGCESTQKVITNDRDAPFSAGQFIWTGWDYIGEPTPYNNTSKSSYFGQIDTAGFAKDTFYLYKAEWGAKSVHPFVHLLPYWDWNVGQMIDVKAYSNCDSVELFVNGKSLGKQNIDHEKGMELFGLWRVPYEKGEIKAVAYDQSGAAVAEETKKSFGDPVKVIAQPEFLQENSSRLGDMYFIDLMCADKDGNLVENARNLVCVQVEGDAELLSMDNGDSTDYDQYVSADKKTHTRRLFGNRLVAIVRAKTQNANFIVKAQSKDLEGTELVFERGELAQTKTLLAAAFAPKDDYVPVRKIEITVEGGTKFDAAHKTANVCARVLPQNATQQEIKFAPMLPESVLSDAVEVNANGTNAKLNAVCDGAFILRVTANNGRDYPEIISELEMSVEGVGNPKFNPYILVEACRCTGWEPSKPKPKNGFTGGISTRGMGATWVSFDKVDFGVEGADEIHLPVFCWDASWPVEVWDGTPQNGECVLRADFCAEYQYNTYAERSFTLTKRLFGVHTISVWLGIELAWHGFRFTQSPKAYAKLRALDADTIVGDSFTKSADAVERIGNNVNLDFGNMNFSEGVTKLTVCGKSNTPNNTINVKFFGEGGTSSTQVIEFAHSDDYTEKTFEIEKVAGKNKVSFVFLPGCDFDFKWFRFAATF